MTIIYWTAAWLAGIALSSGWRIASPWWLALAAGAVIAALFLRHQRVALTLCLCLAILAAGAMRRNLADPVFSSRDLAFYNNHDGVHIRGVVARPPEVRDRSTALQVEADTLRLRDGREQPVRGRLFVRAPRFPAIPYGAYVELRGDLQTPHDIDDFDYPAHLARQGIYSEMLWPELEVIAMERGQPFYDLLLEIKARAQSSINRLLPEPQAALLSGILLGNDLGLPRELQEDFRDTGLSHIIAISGFNMAIIAGVLLACSRTIVSGRAAALIAFLGIGLYTLLVGANAAVVRAAIMATLFIIAVQLLGRPTFAPAALFAAALFMTLANPLILGDAGFQLSFMATLGLMLYVGPWSRFLGARVEAHLGPVAARSATRLLADLLLATLAATLMTLPIILYHFGTLSLISPLANLFVLPAQPGIMLWGGTAALLGMASPMLAQPLAWTAWLFLSYTIGLVRFFASFPLVAIPVSLSLAGAAALYGLIFMLTWLGRLDSPARRQWMQALSRRRPQRAIAGGAALSAVLLLALFWHQPDNRLHVHFLDVGQGDAVFIETPGGRQILVDGGEQPSLLLDELGRRMPFWDKQIDIVVATHSDADHVAALSSLLERYELGLLVTNGATEGAAPSYDALLQAAREQEIAIHPAQAGEVWEIGDGARLEVLYPPAEPNRLAADNDSCVALRLVYGAFSLLLTGDAEEAEEQALLASGQPLAAVVYKAGHHGSRSSSSEALLQAVRPAFVVISAAADNRFGHPHPEMLQRAAAAGAVALRTDELGTIEFISDGRELRWTSQR